MSGYHAHGDLWSCGASALNFGPALIDPSPTTTRMSAAELEESTCPAAGGPGGCDRLLTQACMRLGTYEILQKRAFYIDKGTHSENGWDDAEIRVVWCDHTEWEMPWGAYALHKELQESRETGLTVRDVVFDRLRGANHFVSYVFVRSVHKLILFTRRTGTCLRVSFQHFLRGETVDEQLDQYKSRACSLLYYICQSARSLRTVHQETPHRAIAASQAV